MVFWKYIASQQVLLTISGHCLKNKTKHCISPFVLRASHCFFHFTTFRKEKSISKIHSYGTQLFPCWWSQADADSCIFPQWETSAHAVIPSLMGWLATMLCNRIKLTSSQSECFWRHFDCSRWVLVCYVSHLAVCLRGSVILQWLSSGGLERQDRGEPGADLLTLRWLIASQGLSYANAFISKSTVII